MMTFSKFAVGNTVVFSKTFDPTEFEFFTKMSGDKNPLHWDQEYSSNSKFGKTIVPLHMTISPLSQIAGMYFPGDPSLYLGHEVTSILPVFYKDELTYSAQIVSINEALRILKIHVIVCRGIDVVLEATMSVKSRLSEWTPVYNDEIKLRKPPRTAFVTGGSGGIGSALCEALIMRGWNLLIQDRGEKSKRKQVELRLNSSCRESKCSIEFVNADLTKPKQLDELCELLCKRTDIGLFFHTASPPIHSELKDLVQVNYEAMKRISNALIPNMLINQSGLCVFLSSVATQRVIPGWSDYSASKAMGEQYMTSLNKINAGFGVRGLNILSGLVDTKYSEEVQGDSVAMLPEELADKILDIALDQKASGSSLIEWNSSEIGQTGFYKNRVPNNLMPSSKLTLTETTVASSEALLNSNALSVERIEEIIRHQLKLPDSASLSGGGLGKTPNWDSLRHIEVILRLEESFGIQFSSREIEDVMSFDNIFLAISNHLTPG